MDFYIAKNTRLSENFILDEFLVSKTASDNNIMDFQYKIKPYHVENLRLLCENVLQPLRDYLGGIVRITSGYRSQELNDLLNGSETSDHVWGKAADIVCGDMEKAFLFLKTLEFDQLIFETRTMVEWIHISYRKNANRKQVFEISK